MPVFDFSDTPVANEHPECTYETFHSTETRASADKPIVVIDNKQKGMGASCARYVYKSDKAYIL